MFKRVWQVARAATVTPVNNTQVKMARQLQPLELVLICKAILEAFFSATDA